jgi:hypothetical protein
MSRRQVAEAPSVFLLPVPAVESMLSSRTGRGGPSTGRPMLRSHRTHPLARLLPRLAAASRKINDQQAL